MTLVGAGSRSEFGAPHTPGTHDREKSGLKPQGLGDKGEGWAAPSPHGSSDLKLHLSGV